MLFGKKKEEKKAPVCGCSADNTPAENTGACCCSQESENCCGEPLNCVCCVKVLGAGCKSCHELYENTKEAVKNKKRRQLRNYVHQLNVLLRRSESLRIHFVASGSYDLPYFIDDEIKYCKGMLKSWE